MGSKLENILILGIGGVGMHLARRLVHEGASVTVIETDPKLVQEAAETMDARVLTVSYTHLTLPTILLV